jgi:hypothetical protein
MAERLYSKRVEHWLLRITSRIIYGAAHAPHFRPFRCGVQLEAI